MSSPVVQLGELCQFINGKAFKPTDWSTSGMPIIRIQNLRNTSAAFNYWCGDLSRQILVQRGDLLLAWSGTPGTSFGAHIWNGLPGVLNQHIFLVRNDETRISRDYCLYAINSRLDHLISRAHGGVGLQHFTKGIIQKLEVPLPSLEEQRRIVDLLDRAAGIRRLHEQALAKARETIPALFLSMFGDPASNPKGWLIRKVEELTRTRPNYGTMRKPTADADAWLDIRVGNIAPGELDLRDRKYVLLEGKEPLRHAVHDGDLLMVRAIGSQQHLGKVAVAHPAGARWAFDSHLMRIQLEPSLVRSDFVAQFFTTSMGRTLLMRNTRSSAIQFNINVGELLAVEIPVPPVSLQLQFEERLADLRSIIAQQNVALEGALQLERSLMARLFA